MFYVDSEIGNLRQVLVHSPDSGISRISPKQAEELLFDDIVHLPLMQKEHSIFESLLKAFIGESNVIEITGLIEGTLQKNKALKKQIIDVILKNEDLPTVYGELFHGMSNNELAEVLITGYSSEKKHIFFDPLPNLIFTRDIAVMVKNHLLITKASKKARYRENLLMRLIAYGNDMFKDLDEENRIINLNNTDIFPPSQNGERVTIEGGDVMILEKDYLLIGCSERTTDHAFHSIKEYLLSQNIIKYVVQVNIPSDRSFMHIDTLFTRIDHDKVVCYKPIIYDGMSSNIVLYSAPNEKRFYPSIKEFLQEEINKDMQFIFAGNGESPYQEREQWTDGCNLFTIKPGVAVSYDRNLRTEEAFKNHGFSIRKAEDIIAQGRSDPKSIDLIENTIITIPSAELSRARGGSHCMTCPIWRNKM